MRNSCGTSSVPYFIWWGADGKGQLLYLASGLPNSVLSEFRSRLLAHGAERRLFDLLIEQFRERGWIKGRGKQRTDSTHVRASIRTLRRLECVGETMRHAQGAPGRSRSRLAPGAHGA